MFYLFILESIGTSELILIGLVALIVFGPRKLPEIARTVGKAMNEFRRSTDDFKRTWAQEVEFESGETDIQPKLNSSLESSTTIDNSIERKIASSNGKIIEPQIKELSQADFQESLPKKELQTPDKSEARLTNKQDWL